MTQFLPPNLLALFAPRDPIPYLPPLDKLPHEKKSHAYSGVAQFLNEFEDPKDTPPPTRVETKDERKERKRKERAEQVAYKLEQDLALWDPVTQHPGDAYKSLFVARINYDTSESKLRREFEVYGPVKRIVLVADKNTGKMRGYAFAEYEHERDMHSAYKHADGKKIDGRRVLVDIERGRTIKGWRPRRLGGGLGGTRKGGPDVNTKYSGRDDNPGALGGRDDRSRSRERLPPRRRSRSPREREPRERRRRSRTRSRSRERPVEREPRERERRRRSRSPRIRKDRNLDTSVGPEEEVELVSADPPKRYGEEMPAERPPRYGNADEPRRRRRSRSPRDRSSRRSRSPRESKRRRRSRSRDRKRRSRSRDRRGGEERDQNNEYPPGEYGDGEYGPVQVKEEPENEYPGEDNNGEYYPQYTSEQTGDMDMDTEYKEETIEPISEYGTAFNQPAVEN